MDEIGADNQQLEMPQEGNNGQEISWKVASLRFEKQSSQIVVGTERGYRLVNYSDPSHPTIKRGLLEKSIKLLILIPETKILIYVTSDEPMKVNFYEYHPTPRDFIPAKKFTSSIVALRASISRVAIVVNGGIYLYSSKMENFMVKLHFIVFSVPNPNGLVDLSEHDFNTYLAYPSSGKKGEIEIFDCLSLRPKLNFEAHQNPIVAVSFSPTGRSLATASEKGTLIRVHIVFTGECVYEFRRGLLSPGSINSLGFGIDSKFLGVTSDVTTIHIFRLSSRTWSRSGTGIVFEAIQRATENYLPTKIKKFLNQDKAFAKALLPVEKMDAISLVYETNKLFYLIVATFDGFVYTYSLDDVNGGDCKLIKAVTIEKDNSDLGDEWVVVEKEDKDLEF